MGNVERGDGYNSVVCKVRGGWETVVRGDGYNSVVCKVRGSWAMW